MGQQPVRTKGPEGGDQNGTDMEDFCKEDVNSVGSS